MQKLDIYLHLYFNIYMQYFSGGYYREKNYYCYKKSEKRKAGSGHWWATQNCPGLDRKSERQVI